MGWAMQIDKRSGLTDPITKPLSEGVGKSEHDTESEQRQKHSSPARRDWVLTKGSVVMSLPQLGWHSVALEGKAGIVVAQMGGQADAWGTQSVRALQNGTQVLVASQKDSSEGTIVCGLAFDSSEPLSEYIDQSSSGSWSGLKRDPAADAYGSLTEDDEALRAFVCNPLWDQHAGDWGVRTNTGINVLVDPFGIRLATDEITELSLDYLEQAVRVSGRSVEIQGDSLLIQSSVEGASAVFGLGQTLFRVPDGETFEPIQFETAEGTSYQDSLADWPVHVAPGELAKLQQLTYAYTMLSFAGDTTLRSETDLSDSHRRYHTHGHTMVSGVTSGFRRDLTAHIEHREGRDRETAATEDQAAFEALERLKAAASTEAVSSQLSELSAFLTVATELNPTDAKFVREMGANQVVDYKLVLNQKYLEQGEDNEDYIEQLPKHESVVAIAPGSEAPVGRTASEHTHYLDSLISVDRESGEIAILNEQGAGVRIIGGTVYIEGMQIRLSAVKDVVTLARDVHTSANRNLYFTANSNARLYTKQNLSLLSGIGGTGGTLIENRATTMDQQLEDDPEESNYSGVVLKSSRSHVAVLGGDVIVKSGDTDASVGGRMAFYADGGDLVMGSANRVIQFAPGGCVDAFGTSLDSVAAVNLRSQYTNLFSGELYGQALYSDSEIIARNNVQAVTGHMASRQGGPLGTVLRPQYILEGLAQRSRTIQTTRSSVVDLFKSLKEFHRGSKRVANSTVFAGISTAYPREASDSVYGVTTVNTPLSHEYESAYEGAELQPFEFLEVQYKPDAQTGGLVTKAWPGKNSKPIGVRTSGDPRVAELFRTAHADQTVPWPRYDEAEVTVEQVFKTLKP